MISCYEANQITEGAFFSATVPAGFRPGLAGMGRPRVCVRLPSNAVEVPMGDFDYVDVESNQYTVMTRGLTDCVAICGVAYDPGTHRCMHASIGHLSGGYSNGTGTRSSDPDWSDVFAMLHTYPIQNQYAIVAGSKDMSWWSRDVPSAAARILADIHAVQPAFRPENLRFYVNRARWINLAILLPTGFFGEFPE